MNMPSSSESQRNLKLQKDQCCKHGGSRKDCKEEKIIKLFTWLVSSVWTNYPEPQTNINVKLRKLRKIKTEGSTVETKKD
jgi:hypothetical protein